MLWIEHEQDDVARLGVNEAWVETLPGGLVALELLPAGTVLSAGAGFGFVHAGERTFDLRAPRGMTLLEVNAAVLADARLVAASPHLRGWLVRVKWHAPA